MRFGPTALDDALGAILAHSVQTAAGTLRKGQWLGADAIAALRADGRREVIAARLDADDLHEDAAATRIAAALVPDPVKQGLRVTKAATGRVNLHATGRGVLAVDAAAVDALNAVNPMITLATVPPWFRADPDAMVATVKIISYAVPVADVDRAVAVIGMALRLMPPKYTQAALIETTITGRDPPVKGRSVMVGRLDRLGVTLAPRSVAPHATGPLAAAIAGVAADVQVIFILTASATSDPDDVAPAAVRAAGGQVAQFGIPVDPGNLLFLGSLGDRPVIGLPGCARSPALNGADWVMERVICGVPIGPADLARMGVGGLLTEIPTRPRPREG